MNRLQSSALGKFFAWLLLLAFSFAASGCGLRAAEGVPYLSCDSYYETGRYTAMIREREECLATLYDYERQLNGEDLPYVERQRLSDERDWFLDYFQPENTNFRFVLRNMEGEVVSSNLEHPEELEKSVSSVRYDFFVLGQHFVSSIGGEYYRQLTAAQSAPSEPPTDETETVTPTGPLIAPSVQQPDGADNGQPADVNTPDPPDSPVLYTVECGVIKEVARLDAPVSDEFFHLSYRFFNSQLSFDSQLTAAGLLFCGALLCIVYILWSAGHKAGAEGVTATWQEKIYFDLYAAATITAGTCVFAMMWSALDYFAGYYATQVYNQLELDLLTACFCALGSLLMLLLALTLRTLAVRLKTESFIRTTLLCRVAGWVVRTTRALVLGVFVTVRDFLVNLHITWKVVLACVVCFYLQLFLSHMSRYDGFYALMWICLNGVILLFLCWWAVCFRRLQKGGAAIAAGDLTHQIDTHRMPYDLRRHAEDLNHISGGLQNAVNEQMKSERFKAELITNVSHDLKTPLTSIINYVDLLKATQQTDPKALEYIEVLNRKSQRLKKLTEDLVEASKASTGALTVNREKLGMVQLINQALGEYTEKLEQRKLQLVTTLPEAEVYVLADGRHLWRVLDNLLSNCVKYAMEGTRVYLELARGHGQIILSVKNISRDALNVPPEQLMERFVRGEVSRSTEGSGLGLSIARSLTELQGGTFELAVDGDLFKAIVSLPQMV